MELRNITCGIFKQTLALSCVEIIIAVALESGRKQADSLVVQV